MGERDGRGCVTQFGCVAHDLSRVLKEPASTCHASSPPRELACFMSSRTVVPQIIGAAINIAKARPEWGIAECGNGQKTAGTKVALPRAGRDQCRVSDRWKIRTR